MAAGYRDLLRSKHAARLLIGTLVGRLPNATAALAVVLFTRAEGGSYALAGVLSAVYGVGNAVGQPLLGRAVDHYGQPRVMLPAAVASAVAMAVFAVVGLDPLPVAYAAMLAAGLFTPPLEGGLRALWPGVLGREEWVHAAYALDAVAQEVIFSVGPLLVTALVALWSEAAALLVINVIGVAGALSVVVSPPSRQWRSAPREAHWLGALRSRGLLVLLGTFFFVGIALGSIGVAAVGYADEHGGGMVSSYLLSALGVGALVGGLAYGARPWAGPPERRLRVLVAALALGYLPLVLGARGGRDDGPRRALRHLSGSCARLCLRGRRPARPGRHGHRGVLLAGDHLRGRKRRGNGRRGAGDGVRRGGGGLRRSGGRRGGGAGRVAGHRALPHRYTNRYANRHTRGDTG